MVITAPFLDDKQRAAVHAQFDEGKTSISGVVNHPNLPACRRCKGIRRSFDSINANGMEVGVFSATLKAMAKRLKHGRYEPVVVMGHALRFPPGAWYVVVGTHRCEYEEDPKC